MSYSQALEQHLCLLEHSKTRLDFPVFNYPVQGVVGAPYAFLRALEVAATYYWETSICELIEVMAPTVPEWPLTAADLITPYGFCLFQRPLALPRVKGHTFDRRLNYRTMMGFCWSSDRQGGIWLYSLYASAGTLAITLGGSLGRLQVTPGMAFGWTFGSPITAQLDYGYASDYGAPARPRRELSYLSACLLFMTQQITTTDRHEVTSLLMNGRPSTIEPVVRAVKLRRLRMAQQESTDRQPVNWAQRWIVSGHWRQQFYPSLGDHRPVLISPYVKGPPEKPLKPPRAKVFAVVR